MNTDATLAKLLEGWLDGGLSETEQSDLLRQLDEDANLRHRFAEQVAVIGATRAAADANPRWLALFDLLESDHANDGAARSFEVVTMERIESATRPSWNPRPSVWVLAAAVALLLVFSFLVQIPKTTLEASSPEPSATPLVAVVIGGSQGAAFQTGAYLKPGVISQENGWLTVQTLKGVSVTFDAPFKAVLSDLDRIRLEKGMARVRVPEGAEGFRLESPAFDVVDLGTEFGAKVNQDGTGTCRVFEGKADVSLLDSVGEVKRTKRLTASKSVSINPSSEALQMIEEKDTDYPAIKQAPRPTLALTPSYAADVLSMKPAGYWRFETLPDGMMPNEVAGAPVMRTVGSPALASENGGNHSGELTRLNKVEFFKLQDGMKSMFEGDFTISYFSQLSWLQNFVMISGMRYDDSVKGHPLILQCYADLGKKGIKGSALHAVLRDPPAWDGGDEIVGPARMRPLHWHHIALTRANDTVTILLDGASVARKTIGSKPLDCREIFIGRLNGNTSQSRKEARGMVGHIDELAIFPRALSDKEIARLAMRTAMQ